MNHGGLGVIKCSQFKHLARVVLLLVVPGKGRRMQIITVRWQPVKKKKYGNKSSFAMQDAACSA